MYEPSRDGEAEGLARYVDQQLSAIRASVHGLTEQQARETPCRSTLSIAGIIKHTAQGMRGVTANLRDGMKTVPLTEQDFARYLAGFVLDDDEATLDVLSEFDAARTEYLAAIAGTDPAADNEAPPTPWQGIDSARPILNRYYLVHQVEEMARHAGHADIIREQLDGLAVPTLVMTLQGLPANPFFQPYVPAAGTIGAQSGETATDTREP